MTNNPASNPKRLQVALLVAATLVCLVPFVSRAFNIDEPLFIWVAKHIELHPFDFYGFQLNWYDYRMGAFDIIKNPPLASYYLALAGGLLGWSEVALHSAFLVPAVAAVLGSYALAREFTRHALPAALMTLLSPVFIVSGSTVMCDTMMLAFYVWAVYFWVRGTKTDTQWQLLLAALLVTASSLTKYFGITLIPLLSLYSIASGGQKRKGALYLLVPLAILGGYQWATQSYYGRGLLSDAAAYASRESGTGLAGMLNGLAIGVSFTGGCLITSLFFAGKTWGRKVLAAGAVFVLSLSLLLLWMNPSEWTHAPSWGYYLQFALFFAAGSNILVIAGVSAWRLRDPDTMLLSLWVLGTFLFASVVNWSVNGRSVLPMAPAAVILVLRFIEERQAREWTPGMRELALPVACAFALSMTVGWADFTLAGTARTAANAIAKGATGNAGRLWFQGHWGFQYYMEKDGGDPYDARESVIEPGELMAVPENNCNLLQKVYDEGEDLRSFNFPLTGFVSTMSLKYGSGFYSSRFGALPFRFCTPPDETYHLLVFRHQVNPS